MKYVINLILLLLVVGLGYLLYNSIKEPIAFGTAKQQRVNAVAAKLDKIKKAQELYRGMKGNFAGSFDSLSYVLRNGQIEFVKLTEDPEDPTNPDKFIREVSYMPAIDTVKSLNLGNLDSLKFVPYGEGEVFDMVADTVTYQQTLVSVVEVSTPYYKFMGPYGKKRFMKYDGAYDPTALMKFGDLTKPSLSGNW